MKYFEISERSAAILRSLILPAVLLLLYWFFFVQTMFLPTGEMVCSVQSPNNKYTVCIYIIKGGATTSDMIRGEVNAFGLKSNIYWDKYYNKVECKWVNNRIIRINGVLIDIFGDVYDYRKME